MSQTVTDCVPDSRTLDVLLRRGGDLPLDVACAVLGPVADTLDTLHRRGRSHGAVSATQITVLLRNRELGVELSEPVDGSAGEVSDDMSTHKRPGAPGDIPGDYVSFGSLVVRCLVRTLGSDDRRAIARGHDPVTGRRATSCAALVEAARVAVTPLPGDATDPSDFWEDGAAPLPGLRSRSGGGPATVRATVRRWRRPLVIGAAALGVVALGSVLVARTSGGSTTVAPPTSTTTVPATTTTTGAVTSTTTTTTTPNATPPSSPADPAALSPPPAGAVDTLGALVPTALRDECRASDTTAPTRAEDLALAVLECGTGDVPVRYSLFADVEAMDAAYRASAPAGLRGPTSLSGPPRCLDGEVEERAWSRSPGDPEAGRYRCEIDSTGAAVVWTTDSVAVVARAAATSDEPTAGLRALYRLWRTVLGPVTP